MKVSIIVPIYNVEEYVSQCILSIIAQTYTNIECVIVNDSTKDNSMKICHAILSEYSGSIEFKIINHEKNRGLSAARNTGISASTGDYLYFIDSDDRIAPTCIQELISCVEVHPDVDIVFAGATSVPYDESYNWLDITRKDLPEVSANRRWIKAMMLRRVVFGMTAWNRLVNRHFILSNKLFFPEGYTHEDEVWNFQIAKFVSKVAVCNHNTYYYSIRNNGIILSEDKEEKALAIERVGKMMADNIDPFLTTEQALSIWALVKSVFEESSISHTTRHKLKKLLSDLCKHLDFKTSFVIRIYSLSPSLFDFLYSLPKVRGYINIQMRFFKEY